MKVKELLKATPANRVFSAILEGPNCGNCRWLKKKEKNLFTCTNEEHILDNHHFISVFGLEDNEEELRLHGSACTDWELIRLKEET